MEYTVPAFHNFGEIVQHYRDFLQNKIDACPTHGAPLDPESIGILQQLLAINAAQVVSVDSQPGLLEKEFKQRAYLDCLMEEETYQRLSKKLLETEFMVFANPYAYSDRILNQIPVTLYHGIPCTSLPIGSCNDMEFILENTPRELHEGILCDLWQVRILDPVWGRPTKLFDRVASIKD